MDTYIDFPGRMSPVSLGIGSNNLTGDRNITVEVPEQGTPADKLPYGTIWIDTDDREEWVQWSADSSNPDWRQHGGNSFPTYHQTDAPVSPQDGETWIRPSTSGYPDNFGVGLFRWSSSQSQWQQISLVRLDDGGAVIGQVTVGADGNIVFERFVGDIAVAWQMITPGAIGLFVASNDGVTWGRINLETTQLRLQGSDGGTLRVNGVADPDDNTDAIPYLWFVNYVADAISGISAEIPGGTTDPSEPTGDGSDAAVIYYKTDTHELFVRNGSDLKSWTRLDAFPTGVISGLFVEGEGSSGIVNLPNNSPMYGNGEGYVRFFGNDMWIQSNTIILEPAPDPDLDTIYTYVVQTPGVRGPVDPEYMTFDTLAIAGTPSADPTPPDLDDRNIALFDIYVPAGTTNSADCTITDRRQFVVSSTSSVPTPSYIRSGGGITYQIVVDDDGNLATVLA